MRIFGIFGTNHRDAKLAVHPVADRKNDRIEGLCVVDAQTARFRFSLAVQNQRIFFYLQRADLAICLADQARGGC